MIKRWHLFILGLTLPYAVLYLSENVDPAFGYLNLVMTIAFELFLLLALSDNDVLEDINDIFKND